jgi:uncharacterized lipoprotein YddW (UPF0748 family)
VSTDGRPFGTGQGTGLRRRAILSAAAAAGAAGAGLAGCSSWPEPLSHEMLEMPPPAPREWRAAWVASVAHIDWPAQPGLNVEQQQQAALELIDRARDIGLNALILQVRPAGDALYRTALEPWSEYLTGEQGRAPEPAWDPLAFWAEETARRGLELHAWLNPYRARHPSARSALAAPHLGVTNPEAVKSYGTLLWMDPAEPAAQQRTLDVVADIARRYDIAGIHIDDYFYPYPVRQGDDELAFPDEPAWQRALDAARAGQGPAPTSRADWRRAQVDQLVQAMQQRVREVRPQMSFGISPFGIGRPERRPPGITGFSQYDKLFADVERWLSEGWMDYVAPQLYWPLASAGQAFGLLLDSWLSQNPRGVAMRPGLYSSRVGSEDARAWPAQEIVEQIGLLRSRAGVDGHAHFSLSALVQDRGGLARALRSGPYAQPALLPARPGASLEPLPAAPVVVPRWLGLPELVAAPDGRAFVHALWLREQGRWRFAVLPAQQGLLPLEPHTDALVVSAVDRQGREGPRHAWRIR